MRPKSPITGVVLSGGKNLRMGENKAFIKIGGIPIIQRTLDLFQHLFQEIIIVTNEQELYVEFNAKIYRDLTPNGGALAALHTGLFYSSFPYSFAVGCDMPYLKESVIDYLVQRAEGYDVTIPRTPDGLQPLHAIYSKSCMEAIERLMKEKRAKISDFFPSVRINIVGTSEILPLDPDLESFINLNTPDELTRHQNRILPA